jgi:hypothetical protein
MKKQHYRDVLAHSDLKVCFDCEASSRAHTHMQYECSCTGASKHITWFALSGHPSEHVNAT